MGIFIVKNYSKKSEQIILWLCNHVSKGYYDCLIKLSKLYYDLSNRASKGHWLSNNASKEY